MASGASGSPGAIDPVLADPFADALTTLRGVLDRHSIVFVISDFLDAQDEEPSWELPMRLLARRHDVVALRVTDPREHALPPLGLIELEDPETGRRVLLDTSGRSRRAARRRADEAHESRLRSIEEVVVHGVDDASLRCVVGRVGAVAGGVFVAVGCGEAVHEDDGGTGLGGEGEHVVVLGCAGDVVDDVGTLVDGGVGDAGERGVDGDRSRETRVTDGLDNRDDACELVVG